MASGGRRSPRAVGSIALVLCLGLAAGSCSGGGDDGFQPNPTRDPQEAAARDAAARWLDTYAGGLLVDEDAELHLTDQEQACIVAAFADELGAAAAEAVAAAPSTEQLDAETRRDLAELLQTCSELEQYVYEYLVAEDVGAAFASCVSEAFVSAVTWAEVLDVAPGAATGETDPRRTIATFRDQLVLASERCGPPGATLPI